MGRKRSLLIGKFFKIKDDKFAECIICKKLFQGVYISNLKRHMQSLHKEEYDLLIAEDCNEIPEKQIKFAVTMSQREVKNACLEMVTSENVPFKFFDSGPFKQLTSQIFEGMDMQPITSRNVMELVKERDSGLRKKIRQSLRNRIFSIKIDTATLHNRSILGVNAQYFDGTKNVIYTLGMIELHEKHTALNLSSEINNILDEMGVSKNQIYCVTSDNGRNMIKAVEHINEESEGIDEYDNIEDRIQIGTITSVKCAAHTLQLAVKDYLKHTKLLPVIVRARQLAKNLRCPSKRYMLSSLNLPQPEVDTSTRWNSTYSMLKKLLKFKEVYALYEDESLKLEHYEWEEVENLVQILEPAYKCTLKFQNEQLYLGDFYKLWLQLKLTVRAMNCSDCQVLASYLEKREELLMNNDVVVSAIYLDPRIRRVLLLKPEKIIAAKNHLKMLIRKIFSVSNISLKSSNKSCSGPSPNMFNEDAIEDDENLNSSFEEALLEDFLGTIEVAQNYEGNDESDDLKKAYIEIEEYKPLPISSSTEIMKYWTENQFNMPYLYQLAKVIHSVPATQVSVERAFSALKLIFSDLRCNLSQKSIEHILFVKLNT